MRYDFPDTILDLLRGIPDFRTLRFLELGCGDAHMMERLRSDGVAVRGTTYRDKENDYIRFREYPEGIEVDGNVNLNERLPYADGSFDVVYSSEVMEHIESHRTFVAESARVLRPNGWFVITTPNIHRLLSRFHFALSGVHLVKCPVFQVTEPLDRMEEFHHRCIDFTVLHWLMWNCGLRIDSIATSHVHPLSRLLVLAAPLLRAFPRRALQRYYGETPLDEARQDLIRWMLSPQLLTSEQLCLRARKVAVPNLTAPGTSDYYRRATPGQ